MRANQRDKLRLVQSYCFSGFSICPAPGLEASSTLSERFAVLVSGNVSVSSPATRTQQPQIVVGMYQPNAPSTSTTYGAEMEPTCAQVEQVPSAELRISVG